MKMTDQEICTFMLFLPENLEQKLTEHHDTTNETESIKFKPKEKHEYFI